MTAQLWEDTWGDVWLDGEREAAERMPTLGDALEVAAGAIIRLYKHGRVDLLRELVAGIPAGAFDNYIGPHGHVAASAGAEALKANYWLALDTGEVDPVWLGGHLLEMWANRESTLQGGQRAALAQGLKLTGKSARTRDDTRHKRPGSSKYLGVSMARGRWLARLNYRDKQGVRRSKHGGSYDTQLEAALAYDKLAVDTLGEGASTNAKRGLLPVDTGGVRR